jgi:hypothetical protein
MDASKILKEFAKHLHEIDEKAAFNADGLDDIIKHIEDSFFPELTKIFKKDETIFEVERSLFGVNISQLWGGMSVTTKETTWKYLQATVCTPFLHGDMATKAGKIFGLVKTLWSNSGQENSEVDRILKDDKSEGYFKEILEFVMNSRLLKIFLELVESIDVSDLGINIENPEEFIEMLKNPEHPTIQRALQKVQAIVKEKVRSGKISTEVIQSEVETIKAKIVSLFGNVFNQALGGRRSETSNTVLLGNSPEARRQRMIARLQRKVREKNSQ